MKRENGIVNNVSISVLRMIQQKTTQRQNMMDLYLGAKIVISLQMLELHYTSILKQNTKESFFIVIFATQISHKQWH